MTLKPEVLFSICSSVLCCTESDLKTALSFLLGSDNNRKHKLASLEHDKILRFIRDECQDVVKRIYDQVPWISVNEEKYTDDIVLAMAFGQDYKTIINNIFSKYEAQDVY